MRSKPHSQRVLAVAGTCLLMAAGCERGPDPVPVVIERTAPAVVLVHSYVDDVLLASGTGFFTEAGGRIVTNEHVIAGAETIQIVDANGDTVPIAGVTAIDARADVAVLLAPDGYRPPAALEAWPRMPVVGEEVIVIGNPSGLERSVSTGIISAVREDRGVRLLQMTAPISAGSSGSPVLDRAGNVIGVATSRLPGADGVYFASAIAHALGPRRGDPVRPHPHSGLHFLWTWDGYAPTWRDRADSLYVNAVRSYIDGLFFEDADADSASQALRSELHEVIEIDSHHVRARASLVWLLPDLPDTFHVFRADTSRYRRELLDPLERALEEHPYEPYGWQHLAAGMRQLAMWAEWDGDWLGAVIHGRAAVDVLRRGLAANPTAPELLSELASAHASMLEQEERIGRRVDWPKALAAQYAWLERAVALRPADVSLRADLASKALDMGKADVALQHYESIRRIGRLEVNMLRWWMRSEGVLQ